MLKTSVIVLFFFFFSLPCYLESFNNKTGLPAKQAFSQTFDSYK